jgi:DNA-binding NarL/FixJ family response regulator
MSHTILIVDDSPIIRHSLRACIERNTNWKVCGEADNGKLAVERVQELHPDAVILDLQMPVMNGLEAARHIASVAPNAMLLMLTIHDSEQLLQDARAVGIQQVLSKSDRVADHVITTLRNIPGEPKESQNSKIM